MKDQSSPQLGPRIRALRLERRMSLADLAHSTGVSEATLSRIETGLSDVSAPHLYGLARVLGVDIAGFFTADSHAKPQGVRALTRAGDGEVFQTARLNAQLLCGELRHKKMHPFRNTVTATTLEAVGGLSAHAGEEYLFVLRGPLLFCSAAYEPLRLETGDSLYFDASQPHAYVSGRQGGAEFLVVSSTDAPNSQKDQNHDP